MRYDSDNPIPGTNGEMTERDLYHLLKHLSENGHSDCFGCLPVSERGINTLVMITKATKEELIEGNRVLYEAKEWERYL